MGQYTLILLQLVKEWKEGCNVITGSLNNNYNYRNFTLSILILFFNL